MWWLIRSCGRDLIVICVLSGLLGGEPGQKEAQVARDYLPSIGGDCENKSNEG